MSLLRKCKLWLGERYLLYVQYPIWVLCSWRYCHLFAKYAGQKTALLTLLPVHNNLGDHAIAEAARHYIERYYPDYQIVELEMPETFQYAHAVRRYLDENDLVFIIGGGNLGSLYLHEERTRRFVISFFRRQRVVQLPQTIHFEDSSSGRRQLRISQRIYGRHPRLTLMARDATSHAFVQQHFSQHQILACPDIVLMLRPEIAPDVVRNGVGICLRSARDPEAALDDSMRTALRSALEQAFGILTSVNTLAQNRVHKHQRKQELHRIWATYASVAVVVTDRLHAMIFCAITGTPCVVLPSFNHKVREGYERLQMLSHIRFVEVPDVAAVLAAVDQLNQQSEQVPMMFDPMIFDLQNKAIAMP